MIQVQGIREDFPNKEHFVYTKCVTCGVHIWDDVLSGILDKL